MNLKGCFRMLCPVAASAVLAWFCLASPAMAGEKGLTTKKTYRVGAIETQAAGIIIKYKATSAQTKGISVQHAGQNAASLGFAKASEAANRQGTTLLFDKPLAAGGYLLKQSVALRPEKLRELVAEIAKDPAVEYVEVDSIRRRYGVPNDPDFGNQWHYLNVTGGINMPAAWDLSIGSGVRVAVIDSGVTSHPDLTPNLVGGYDFVSHPWVANDGNGRDADPSDPGDSVTAYENWWYCGGGYVGEQSSWHGTHVAGTVGAVTNNGVGVSGVAFGARVVPIRVLGKCGGLTSDIADAIIWAAGGSVAGVPANPYPAKVINLSLGGEGACSATEQAAINVARSLGAVVVVAAGNAGDDMTRYSPGNCIGALTVAATSQNGGRWSLSNYGASIGLAAPGDGVLSTYNWGVASPGDVGYAHVNGTSMATPHVSGVAALVLSLNPGFSPDQVAARIKLGSKVFPSSCSGCGAGLLNAYNALVPPTFDAGTVFRFYNLNTGVHLFTATPSERDSVLGGLPWYLYERSAFKVRSFSEAGSSPVYRFRNRANGAYLFTISEVEKNAVMGMPEFVLEGVAWWARHPASPGAGTIPLHRFRYLPTGSHFYSYSPAEVSSIQTNLSHLYYYEGITFYVWPL